MTRRPVYGVLLALTCSVLLVLPLVTTVDDFLTMAAMRLGLDGTIQWLVPMEARAVVAILGLVGVSASAYHSELVLHTVNYSQPLYISWNCVGWQRVAFLGLSLVTGLRVPASFEARLQVLVVGGLGTVIVNLLRIAAVAWAAARFGYVPAVLFHDYGGTLITVLWLFAFWAFAYRWILPRADEAS